MRSNTLLSDESQRTQHFPSRALLSPDGQIHIDICQRFVSRRPTFLKGSDKSTASNEKSSSKMNYSIRKLRRLTIPNLIPADGHPESDIVDFAVTYEPNHTLHFVAQYRGHTETFEGDTMSE